MTELEAAEIAVRMSWAAYRIHSSALNKRRHFRNVGRVATLRTRAAALARAAKAGTAGPANPYSKKVPA